MVLNKKNMDKYNKKLWFRWDHGARNDKKVVKLIQNEGHSGYGMFVQICEILYENEGHADFDYICWDLRCSDDSGEKERLKRVLNDYGLFTCKDEKKQVYTSERIIHEIIEMNKRQKSGSNAAKIRWKNKTHKQKEFNHESITG
jgi:hypothetical protein